MNDLPEHKKGHYELGKGWIVIPDNIPVVDLVDVDEYV
jgi:hypothetical protein